MQVVSYIRDALKAHTLALLQKPLLKGPPWQEKCLPAPDSGEPPLPDSFAGGFHENLGVLCLGKKREREREKVFLSLI